MTALDRLLSQALTGALALRTEQSVGTQLSDELISARTLDILKTSAPRRPCAVALYGFGANDFAAFLRATGLTKAILVQEKPSVETSPGPFVTITAGIADRGHAITAAVHGTPDFRDCDSLILISKRLISKLSAAAEAGPALKQLLHPVLISQWTTVLIDWEECCPNGLPERIILTADCQADTLAAFAQRVQQSLPPMPSRIAVKRVGKSVELDSLSAIETVQKIWQLEAGGIPQAGVAALQSLDVAGNEFQSVFGAVDAHAEDLRPSLPDDFWTKYRFRLQHPDLRELGKPKAGVLLWGVQIPAANSPESTDDSPRSIGDAGTPEDPLTGAKPKPRFEGLAPQLENYIKRLRRRLRALKVDHFINLGLSKRGLASYQSKLRTRQKPAKAYTIFQLVTRFSRDHIAVIGEPGAGKTTLLVALASRTATQQQRIPVFVQMGFFSPGQDLKEYLDLQEFSPADRDALLAEGRLLIIFDGINEATAADVDTVLQCVLTFINRYHLNQFVLSCRTAEFPDWAHAEFLEVSVLPPSMEDIHNAFVANLGDQRGDELFKQLSADRHTRFAEFCRNPLLLAMLISLFEGPDGRYEQPGSRAQVYEQFVQRLRSREERKFRPPLTKTLLPVGLREALLGRISLEMQRSERVFVPEEMIHGWLNEAINHVEQDRWWHQNERPTVQELVRLLLSQPVFKAVSPYPDSPRHFGFLHQSFGEYYAATHLNNGLQHQNLQWSDLDWMVLDVSRKQWEVLTLLAGLAPSADGLLSYIKSRARALQNQRLFVLCGQCIRDAAVIDPTNIDDTLIRMLDAFKYWAIPFDYELIRAIRDTIERRSAFFPTRLAQDAAWFVEKYAQVIPLELREASTADLLDYLSSEDPTLCMDAAYTLGRRPMPSEAVRSKVVERLIGRLPQTTGDVHEQLLSALKELSHPSAVTTFLSILDDPSESGRSKVYALNGLGRIGDLDAARPIMRYLEDHANLYRDSASWSLQMLGKIADKHERDLFRDIKATYVRCLLSETSDAHGRYAQGNIVYSLAVLGATEYLDQIISWFRGVKDPYVLEDAINALGLLEGPEVGKLVAPFLQDDDPVVRMKAAEALGRLHFLDAIGGIERLRSDPLEVVREAADSAIGALVAKGAKL